MREKLLGGDLRSISSVNKVVGIVDTQEKFDELFVFLSETDRLLRMRAIDAIEKISIKYPEFLIKHKSDILNFCNCKNIDKEFKWHLALLLPRLPYKKDSNSATIILKKWILDINESKIVRVNSLQGLYEFTKNGKFLQKEFDNIVETVKKEKVPSINARLKKMDFSQKNFC